MKTLVLVIIGFIAAPAAAREATQVATAATAVAADGVNQPQIRLVGRLNVNTASRAELLKLVDLPKVDALIAARPVADLTAFGLSDEVLKHLKTEGDSNLVRIQQNPLVRVTLTASR